LEFKIANNKILALTFTFVIKYTVELRRNFEKLKMIHKQKLHSLQPSGKSSIAEIEIEIAFTIILGVQLCFRRFLIDGFSSKWLK